MVTDFAPKHDRIQALDCLRFVAVAGVVLFHYGFKGPLEGGARHTRHCLNSLLSPSMVTSASLPSSSLAASLSPTRRKEGVP